MNIKLLTRKFIASMMPDLYTDFIQYCVECSEYSKYRNELIAQVGAILANLPPISPLVEAWDIATKISQEYSMANWNAFNDYFMSIMELSMTYEEIGSIIYRYYDTVNECPDAGCDIEVISVGYLNPEIAKQFGISKKHGMSYTVETDDMETPQIFTAKDLFLFLKENYYFLTTSGNIGILKLKLAVLFDLRQCVYIELPKKHHILTYFVEGSPDDYIFYI